MGVYLKNNVSELKQNFLQIPLVHLVFFFFFHNRRQGNFIAQNIARHVVVFFLMENVITLLR